MQVRAGGWGNPLHLSLQSLLRDRDNLLCGREQMISLLEKASPPGILLLLHGQMLCAQNKLLGLPSHLCLPHTDGAVRLTLPRGIVQGWQRGKMAAKEGKPSRAHLSQALIGSGLLPTIIVPLRFGHRAPMSGHTHSYIQITHTHRHIGTDMQLCTAAHTLCTSASTYCCV